MRKKLLAGLAVGMMIFVMVGTGAQAVLLPTTTSNQVVLNFDFTSSTPSPPYSAIQFIANVTSVDPTTLTLEFYDGLNAFGTPDTRTFPSYAYSVDQLAFAASLSMITDGLFSVGLYDPAGNAIVTIFSAQGQIYGANFQATPFITYPLTPAPVPVPATMLLLGTGLACLIGARKKRKHSWKLRI